VKPTITVDLDDIPEPPPNPIFMAPVTAHPAPLRPQPQQVLNPQSELERLLSAAVRSDDLLVQLQQEKATIDQRLIDTAADSARARELYDAAMTAKRKPRPELQPG
jgi:hypothetical protein